MGTIVNQQKIIINKSVVSNYIFSDFEISYKFMCVCVYSDGYP